MGKNWTTALGGLAALAGALFWGLPAQAEGLPKRLEFGRIGLGAAVRKVPQWAIKSDCNRPETAADCGFYDREGVEYNVFDGYVCEKTFHVYRYNFNAIPYGIDYRGTRAAIVNRLAKRLKLKFTEVEKSRYTSEVLEADGFTGVAINLRFDRNDRLSTVNLWSNCT